LFRDINPGVHVATEVAPHTNRAQDVDQVIVRSVLDVLDENGNVWRLEGGGGGAGGEGQG
jgi:hypothetical protein